MITFFSITISIKFSRRKHYWKKKKNSQCSLLYYRNMEIIYMHISDNCLVIITVRNRKQNWLFSRKETWKDDFLSQFYFFLLLETRQLVLHDDDKNDNDDNSQHLIFSWYAKGMSSTVSFSSSLPATSHVWSPSLCTAQPQGVPLIYRLQFRGPQPPGSNAWRSEVDLM